MVVGKDIRHRYFRDITDHLEKGDTLVLNDSRVIPAKLQGKKSTGGHVETLVVSKTGAGYECLIQGKNIRKEQCFISGNLKPQSLKLKGTKWAPGTWWSSTATGT